MKTIDQALEAAISLICDHAGWHVAEGIRSIKQTLEANGYVIVSLKPTTDNTDSATEGT